MIKKQGRIKEDQEYQQFLRDPEKEDEARQLVLKPGKVKPIHIDERAKYFIGVEWDNILNRPCLYTCSEVDALLDAQDELSELDDVDVTGADRHSFLMYDPDAGKWIDYELDQDFEDIDFSQADDMYSFMMASAIIADSLWGSFDLEDT